jgi:hypothetical protein
LQIALRSRHGDLFGVGRGSVLCPDLPIVLRNKQHLDDLSCDLTSFAVEPIVATSQWLKHLPRIPLIGAGVDMAWHLVMIRRLANSPPKHLDPARISSAFRADYNVGGIGAVLRMWFWVCAPLSSSRLTWVVLIISFFCCAAAVEYSISGSGAIENR